MLWNSIATGKRADKHGICSFVEPLPDLSGIRPVTSRSRKCKAIWNILSQAGMTSNVVSWFASHPAEPIRGAVVTDRYAVATPNASAQPTYPEGTFHPQELENALAPLAVSTWEIPAEAILTFVPRAADIDQDQDDRLVKLASIISRASTVQAAACRLAASDDWDFMAVYYSAMDEFGHYFMPYHPPRLAGVNEQDAEIYGGVMTHCYQFLDMMLEALLAYAGSETTVLLVSDHGFHCEARRPSCDAWINPESWHREFGIACAAGPGIRRGERLYGATLLDVTPTVLSLLGLPIGDDMDGRPWLEIFAEPVQGERIESWENVPGDAGVHSKEVREHPNGAGDVIRRLIALGYMEAPSAHADETVCKAVRDAKINLAVAVTSSRRASQALPHWKELLEEYPHEEGFQLQLACCLLRLGRWGECHDALEALSDGLRQSSFVQLIQASVAQGEGRAGDALSLARRVASQPMYDYATANRLGQLFLELKTWDDAERAFQRSLAIMPENAVALDGLAQVSMVRRQFLEAIEHALGAVGLLHFFPAAHFHLAEALCGAGRPVEAIAAYETSLRMGFEPATTHARLAALYRLRNPGKAEFHDRLALPT
jgi:tetratricopeptide (TPR) repeat protein